MDLAPLFRVHQEQAIKYGTYTPNDSLDMETQKDKNNYNAKVPVQMFMTALTSHQDVRLVVVRISIVPYKRPGKMCVCLCDALSIHACV